MKPLWNNKKFVFIQIFIQNCNSSSQFKEFVKFRKTKMKPLISIKMDFLIQFVNVSLKTLLLCWDFSKKKAFGWCKSQIFFVEDQNAGRGDRMAEARRRSKRHGDGFSGPGVHFANLEARRSFLQGAWLLCAASLFQL